jgi:hypothetical protein
MSIVLDGTIGITTPSISLPTTLSNLTIGTATIGSSMMNIVGYNAYGGTGYQGFLSLTNTYVSATNPNKYLRLNSAGSIEIVNSAYNAVLFTFDNAGNFVAAANVTAYSDARLKTDIKTIDNALDKVTQLRGVTFTKDGVAGLGVIAQEVQKVIPEVVITNEDPDSTLSVAYGNIVGLLIEAIKELKTEIDQLKGQK